MSSESINKLKLILASKSPRRQYLLKALGFNFEVHTKEVDESFPSELKAEQIPLYLSDKKAMAFDEDIDDQTIVITSDTVVWINGQVLNKPESHDEAFNMLKLLSGNTHEVFTGVTLMSKSKKRSFSVATKVTFNSLSDKEINDYITEFKPFDKAGSYGAQECLPPGMNPCSAEEISFLTHLGKINVIEESKSVSGFPIVKKIDGPYFNVMGLPVKELYDQLNDFIQTTGHI